MEKEEIMSLIAKYLDKTASPDEIEIVDRWYESTGCDCILYPPESSDGRLAYIRQLADLKAKLGLDQLEN